ncbi:MAG: GxxExxY protein [Flavobacterium sp.]
MKTVEEFTDVPTTQVLTFLKLGNYKIGLVLNFYATTLKNGIKRMIN